MQCILPCKNNDIENMHRLICTNTYIQNQINICIFLSLCFDETRNLQLNPHFALLPPFLAIVEGLMMAEKGMKHH